MSSRRILVIGSGKRVREAALPVITRSDFELDGIVSRKPKTIEAEGHDHEVLGLDSLTRERLTEVDLVYMVVSKPAVPKVLRQLVELDVSSLDLLIETPVMLVRHLGHRHLLEAFRNVWVSEDCTTLPCFDVLKSFVASGAIGDLVGATFDRSAYAYHGMAMVKTALAGERIVKARQRKLAADRRERTIVLDNGRSATVFDPRDYSRGTLLFQGASGAVSDVENSDSTTRRLEVDEQAGRCTGFSIGDERRVLTENETQLMGERGAGPGVTAWMDGMKRVGFLALMKNIAEGRGAYPLQAAIEDSVVDYHLEKLGRYRSTPITNPNAKLTRLAFSILTRLTDR